jgi:hypothetical protein
MDEAKQTLIRNTLGVWQARVNGILSEEEARKIAENTVGFFTVLLDWEARDQENQRTEIRAPYYAKSA